MTEISVVIVTWNARAYTEECLRSLFSGNLEQRVEVIVVDNASTDGTPEMIRSAFPKVNLIETGANLGFAKGNNIGIRHASGNYICLINSDVNVPPDCLSKLRQYMEQNPRVGLVGPKMLGPDGTARRSGMRFPSVWNSFLRAFALDSMFKGSKLFGGLLMSDFKFDRTRDIEVLNGWFWMTRKEALDEVGPLDERFFMYGEDIDWCKRFQLAGWRVVFFADAEAVHYGGGSSANAPVRFFVELHRANLQYWQKYHGPAARLLNATANSLNHVIRIMGWGLVYLAQSSKREKARREVKQNAASLQNIFT